jgi:uncharacterized repeat protein (TIGR01451 family)
MLPPPVQARPLASLDSVLSWQLGNLPAGAERRLTADFRAGEAGEMHLRPRARFSIAVGLRSDVVQPPFSLVVGGPWKALPGEKVKFTIRVANYTKNHLRRVQIRCKLGPGLRHPQGDLIETEVSDGLAPGEQRNIELSAEACGTGGQRIVVTGVADEHLTAQSEALVEVAEQALVARLHGPRQAMLGNEVAFRVEVYNPGQTTAVGVRLRQALPKGLEFVSASTSAGFDAASQAIIWNLAELQGGQRQSVTFQVRARQAGDWALLPAVLADNIASSTAPHAVHVETAPTLTVEVTSDDDALGPGRETTFEVRVCNQGAAPAHAVNLAIHLPDNLAVAHGDGPTPMHLQGQLLLFDPLPELRGRAVAVYRLQLRGQQSGAGLLRAVVQAGGMNQPVESRRTLHVTGAAAQPPTPR